MGNLYMQIGGISGSVSTQAYERWIGLLSANFTGKQVSQAVSAYDLTTLS